jgi:hypothetical protein
MRYTAACLVVLALAGCGGSSAGVSGGAASIVPSTADAFFALDSHLNASQWPAVAALLERFPVQDPVLAKLQTLKLGREIDLVDVSGSLVILTRSSAQLSGFVSKKIGGWTAFAHNSSTFASLGGNATLASSREFKQAMATIPAAALARAYAGPGAANRFHTGMPGQDQIVRVPFGRVRAGGPAPSSPTAAEQTLWAAAAVVGGSHDVTLEAHLRVLPPSSDVLATATFMDVPLPEYPARLIDEIPADALVVADFRIGPSEFELDDAADLPAPLFALSQKSASFLNAVDTILSGETAIYVRPGNEITLVTQPSDTATAAAQVAALAPLFPGVHLHVSVLGGEIVVSTSKGGLDAFRGSGAKLASSADFRRMGLPPETTGFVYADLRKGSAALALIAPFFGLSVPAGPEQALLSYATRIGTQASSVLFLQTG